VGGPTAERQVVRRIAAKQGSGWLLLTALVSLLVACGADIRDLPTELSDPGAGADVIAPRVNPPSEEQLAGIAEAAELRQQLSDRLLPDCGVSAVSRLIGSAPTDSWLTLVSSKTRPERSSLRRQAAYKWAFESADGRPFIVVGLFDFPGPTIAAAPLMFDHLLVVHDDVGSDQVLGLVLQNSGLPTEDTESVAAWRTLSTELAQL
jgi:hypothetical protein